MPICMGHHKKHHKTNFHLGRLNMEFQQDCPEDKKIYSSFNFLAENLEKFRSTEHYGTALEGSTIFLYRSSTGPTSMESYRIAELKYAIFSRTGRKHGLLERSTFLFQYRSMTHAPLESSRLGELKYAISSG